MNATKSKNWLWATVLVCQCLENSGGTAPCMPREILPTPLCGSQELSEDQLKLVYERLANVHCSPALAADEFSSLPITGFLLCTLQNEGELIGTRLNAAHWLSALHDPSGIPTLVALVSAPWPVPQTSEAYQQIHEILRMLGAIQTVEAYDAVLPMTESGYWNAIVGEGIIADYSITKEQIVHDLRLFSFDVLADTGDSRAITMFSEQQTLPFEVIPPEYWENFLEQAQMAAAGETYTTEGGIRKVVKKEVVLKQLKAAKAQRELTELLLPNRPAMPSPDEEDECCNMETFNPLQEELVKDLTPEQQELFALANTLQGDSQELEPLAACSKIAVDGSFPEALRRWAHLKPIELLTYIGHIGEALRRGDNWLQAHPTDPEGWKIRVIQVHIICTRGGANWAPTYEDVRRYCDALFQLDMPRWSVIKAHFEAEYKLQFYVSAEWPWEQIQSERLRHVQRAHYLAHEILAEPNISKEREAYTLQHIREDIDTRLDSLTKKLTVPPSKKPARKP